MKGHWLVYTLVIHSLLIGTAVALTVVPYRPRLSKADRTPHPLDPDHLICNGAGGAFLHPTHIFAGAVFRGAAPDDASKATAAIYANAHHECTCKLVGAPRTGVVPFRLLHQLFPRATWCIISHKGST